LDRDDLLGPDLDHDSFAMARSLLLSEGELACRVVSGSMEPVIPTGSSILIKPIAEPLRRFDIAVFCADSKLICHFVWARNKTAPPGEPPETIFRSLHNLTTDLPVRQSALLGRVVNFEIDAGMRVRIVARMFLRRIFHQ